MLAVYVVIARRAWAWMAALVAHLFAIAGFVVGIAATRNSTTPFNHDYHFVMLAVFILGLALLWLPGARAARGGGSRATPRPNGRMRM